MNEYWDKKIPERIYLPSSDDVKDGEIGLPFNEEIENYRKTHFPYPENNNESLCYSIPISYVPHGQPQGAEAERISYERLSALKLVNTTDASLWQVCFQGIAYAGRTYKKESKGLLIPKEHDLVVFNKFNDEYFISLIEIKSSCNTLAGRGHENLSKISKNNESTIKSNKRTGMKQIKDHLEIIKNSTDITDDKVNTYLFWPFLTMYTTNPRGEEIKRWQEEKGLHVFTDTLSDQDAFNLWFRKNVLSGKTIDEESFYKMFERFIVLSCGIFVNEIHEGMMALLTPDQVHILYNTQPKRDGSPSILHGGAGTGKTLLILHRLEYLKQHKLLNAENKALYICMHKNLGYDFTKKLQKKNLKEYVEVILITSFDSIDFSYRHVFLDDCDSLFYFKYDKILDKRLPKYDEVFYNNHCAVYKNQEKDSLFGDYWIFVNVEQMKFIGQDMQMRFISLIPKLCNTPDPTLSQVARNPKMINDFIKALCKLYTRTGDPTRTLPRVENYESTLAHNINGPSIQWIDSNPFSQQFANNIERYCSLFNALVKCLVDLNSTKGIKASDICVLYYENMFSTEEINKALESKISRSSKGYMPIIATNSFEDFTEEANNNKFLFVTIFKVFGLEFKVIVIVVGEIDNFDLECSIIYLTASRCTCFLTFVCDEKYKNQIDVLKNIKKYKFDTKNIND